MFAGALRLGTIDRVGIALSGLCVVHCLTSAIMLAVLASAGGILVDHSIHAVGLVLAIAFGIVEHGFMMPSAIGGLGLGVMAGALSLPHDSGEVVYTILGVAILALGHDLNRRAII